MGNKVFISYKYADNRVQNLRNAINSTVRDYVDEFISKVNSTDDIYKGEHDGEVLTLNDVPLQFGEYKKYRDRRVTVQKLE